MGKQLGIWLAMVVIVWPGWYTPATAAEHDSVLADELALRAAGLATSGPELLNFFQKRSQEIIDKEQLALLVQRLGDSSAEIREKAAAELICIGPAAIPWLRQLVHDPDYQVAAAMAERCLPFLESNSSGALAAAAARLVAHRQPANMVPVLLGYLPFADNESVVEEVKNALTAVAYRDGKADEALLKALEDPFSLRRAVAIDVLCQAGTAEPRATLRRLLKDEKPIVRMRSALALANVKEPEAIAVLIDLLAELPQPYGQQVEEFLINLASDQAPKTALGADPESRKKCSAAWKTWWAGTAGTVLVDEIRKRMVPEADRNHVQALIQKLGDDSFVVREKAQTDLLGLGIQVAGELKLAAMNPDVEISTRARQLLAQIEKNKGTAISPIVVRLISYRKPPGSAEALLGLVPLAEDEGILAEIQEALNALAFAEGQPDPVLVKALAHKAPEFRAVAAEALCQPGSTQLQGSVRRLLRDPEAIVRMKAAMALASIRDKEAIPALIACLGDLPPERSFPVEEYLMQLAGDKAPAGIPGTDEAARKKRRDSWNAWWKENEAKILLAAMPRTQRQYYYGYTLICMPNNGQVMELGTDGKIRWQLTGLQNPMDVQVLSGNRILIAEYSASQVTERNTKNEILWRKQVNYPMSAQRLANGNTFIVSRNQMIEVDRKGKEVSTINRNQHDIMAAHKLRDGQIAMVSSNGNFLRLDAAGKELKNFLIPNGAGSNYIDFTAKGTVIVPIQWNNMIYEYDADGKQIWDAGVQQPIGAYRLPNGNTVVSTQSWPAKVYEMDKTGKVIWEHQTPTYPGRVKRR
jgi:HEAT repeat protein